MAHVFKRTSYELMIKGLRICFAAGFFLLSGCAGLRRPPAIPADADSAERVLAALEANYSRMDHFKGQARLQIAAPGRALTLDAHVIIDRPDTIYVRLEALFGMDVGWLFSNRREYLFYLPMQNLYGRGPADSLRFEDYLDFAPDYDQLLSALTGLDLARHLADPRLIREGKILVLAGDGALGHSTYWIDAGRGVVTRAEVQDSTGNIILTQQFERFSRLNGVQVPHTIKIQRPRERQAMTLFYEQISINKKFSLKDIKIKIPASAHRMIL